ncbi:dicarboxylate/amino acid:cation symporter [Bdellovibrio sp. HCB185ZH]|uniref:dicarboxylate/amino acid:cation symporter n=1 Tax=Bdellovibrio sp. HCB185ZH TaxID=3394235 RepID=UPI0039A4EA8E
MIENDIATEKALPGLRELIRTYLWLKLLIAMSLGVGTGFLLLNLSEKYPGTWVTVLADWLALPGSVYLTVIQMVVVPLILSSIVLALSQISQDGQAKKIATTAVIYIMCSTAIAATIGITVVEFIKPGEAIQESAKSMGQMDVGARPGLSITPQTIVKLIPENILGSLISGNLQEIILIAIVFGLVFSRMDRDKSKTFLEFLVGTKALCMQIITWTVRLAPYAIFGLMVRAIVNSGASVLLGMAGYLFSVMLAFVLLAVVYLLWLMCIGIGPLTFLQKSKEPLLLAFSLSSSAATMPTTIQTAKDKFKIQPEIADFLIPLGTSVNMAGSALWMSSATLFLAQAFGGDIDLPTVITIILMTVGASLGTPGVPGAGLGVLSSTLRSVGVPPSGMPLILGIDRLVDMGATVMNVMSDLVMCLTAQWNIRRKERKK